MNNLKSRKDVGELKSSDITTIYNLLQTNVFATNQETRQMSEKKILEAELCTGYLSCLYEIIMTTNEIPQEIRLLASIRFKNSVHKYWKENCNYGITKEEKTSLRPKLLNFINQNNQLVLKQLYLSVGRIARIDFPNNWNDLISDLIQCIQQTNKKFEILKMTKRIMKELSSKKLPEDKEIFSKVSESFLSLMCQFWLHSMNEALKNSNTYIYHFKNVKLCTKIITELIVGLKNLTKTSIDFLGILIEKMNFLIKNRKKENSFQSDVELFQKLLSNLIQVPLKVQTKHQILFKPMIIPYLDFCQSQILSPPLNLNLFLVRCFNIFSNIISCREYEKENENPESLEINETIEKYLTDQVIEKMMQKIIQNYMVLTKEELELWSSDPEEFIILQEMDDVDHSIKNSSEHLYIVFLELLPSKIQKFIVEYSNQVFKQTKNSMELSNILLRDSCYSAIGWGVYDLYEIIDFNNWFNTDLINEMKIDHPNYTIIKRRIAWLLGKWVERMNKNARMTSYQYLYQLMCQKDQVLQLTSLLSLESMIDEIGFEKSTFKEYLKLFVPKIFELIPTTEQEDMSLKYLNLLSLLIERMEELFNPYIEEFLKLIPSMWLKCEKLQKASIIRCISKLVPILNSESEKIHSIILPIIDYSTNIDNPEQILMTIEDGLVLWKLTIQYCLHSSDNLLKIYSNIFKINKYDFGNLTVSIAITDAYLLLSYDKFLTIYSNDLNQFFLSIIGEVRPKGALPFIDLLTNILILFPKESILVFEKVFQKILFEILRYGFDSSSNEKEDFLIISNYIPLFCRILLNDRNTFYSFFEKFAKDFNQSPQNLFKKYLEIWLESGDHIVHPIQRKVSSIALLSLLPSNDDFILQNFPLIFNQSIETLYEIDENFLKATMDDMDSIPFGDAKRKRELMKRDQYLLCDVYSLIKSKMIDLEKFLGQEKYQSLLNTVDPVLFKQLDQYPK
eukprot:gene913-9822_t